MFHCSFSDDLLMILWKNIADTTQIWMQTVEIIEVYNVIIIRALMFLCCFIEWSLMILWRIFDNILMISMQTIMTINYCSNLGDIDVSLLLRRWFADDPLKRDFETLIISMEIFFIFINFIVLTSDSLMFPCCFVDDSLMILWRYIFETLTISMEVFWSLLFLLC